MKWCPACSQEKPVHLFGLDATREDGLSGWCRACRADAERARRCADPEKCRAELRERYRRDPARFKAKVYAARAVARGFIKRPPACPVCNENRKLEMHHHAGYARENWLNIVWRCRQCHALEHKRNTVEIHKAA